MLALLLSFEIVVSLKCLYIVLEYIGKGLNDSWHILWWWWWLCARLMYLLSVPFPLRTRAFQREERNLTAFLAAPIDKWVASTYDVSPLPSTIIITLSPPSSPHSLPPLPLPPAGWSTLCCGGLSFHPYPGPVEGEEADVHEKTASASPHQKQQLLTCQEVRKSLPTLQSYSLPLQYVLPLYIALYVT